jgi:coenzyme Q-binding protein COQ10
MPSHGERRELPYTAQQMYELIADVKQYPKFLPWVSAIRIRKDEETEMLADMVVGFKSIKETFSSRVMKVPYNSIIVDYIDGPMKYLNNRWVFEDAQNGGCSVGFDVDFSFRNPIFEKVAGQFFESALRKMTGAFIARAHVLYGDGTEEGKSKLSA